MTHFHKFLLRHRPYCELCSNLVTAWHIIKVDGHDTAVCDKHFGTSVSENQITVSKSQETDWYIPKQKRTTTT